VVTVANIAAAQHAPVGAAKINRRFHYTIQLKTPLRL
jgi:hypothetical protein